MATYVSGAQGSIKIGSLTVCVSDWEFTESADRIDTSNTCDAGYGSSIAGIKNGEGRAKMFWDTAAPQPLASPLVKAGTEAAFTLYIGSPTNDSITFNGVILSGTTRSAVREAVTYEITFASQGAITYVNAT